MNVLVVDDDPGVRALLRRVLVRDFNVNVIEADDGVAGLERLLAQPIDLMLLDLHMRVMDGLRTLEAVRRSPKYADLRVIMLTGIADQERVTRAMQLGVMDFIVKPLTQAILRERLSWLLEQRPQPAAGAASPLPLRPSDRIIILDSDEEFRRFFAAQLSICTVEGVDSELAALKASQRGPVAALFVGELAGQLDLEVFLHTFRDAHKPQALPIFAVVASAELESARGAELYDNAIVRSSDAESFTRSLTHVLDASATARLLFAPASPCVEQLLAFACAMIGGLIKQPVTAADPDRRVTLSSAIRWLFGSVGLQCAGHSWELRLHVPFAIVLRMSSALRQVPTDRFSEPQVLATAGEIAVRLAQHLREDMRLLGLQVKNSPMRMGLLPSAEVLPGSELAASGTARLLCNRADDPIGVIQLSSAEHERFSPTLLPPR